MQIFFLVDSIFFLIRFKRQLLIGIIILDKIVINRRKYIVDSVDVKRFKSGIMIRMRSFVVSIQEKFLKKKKKKQVKVVIDLFKVDIGV